MKADVIERWGRVQLERWAGLTSQDVVLVVVIGLGSDFDETGQTFRGHELRNQVFIVLQEKRSLSGYRSPGPGSVFHTRRRVLPETAV